MTHTVAEIEIDRQTDALVGEWLTLREVGDSLGLDLKRVKQLLRDHKLLGVQRAAGLCVPAAFISDGQPLKGLNSTLTVLADSGLDNVEALRWLFTEDESLPGTPVQALTQHRLKEINRRAQALAL
ncbi:Rv2175c family DNA-binding protein [Actinoallomurus purpureus]|uniref:Rv2175c family DNA-binding protein n=1 Tax=Actinoallomurus purpureus TaxID=478114 RepID=UPI0020921C36|nr:Rv2175c family DNA-binding protein [Actinoallomurus purpureus]MCO6005726.1 Rv2175c family DNA-binding protein [Actinoallomurus purpureus]